ncbi:MAG: efflux transporter outer membrane subunit [Burkholderiaceae bacterium]
MAAGLSGCLNLAPAYRQPPPPLPSSFADRATDDASSPTARSADQGYDLGWNDFIGDPRLRGLVAQALRNNRDLRVSTLNIEKARALYRIQDAQRLPTVDAVASATRTRASGFTTTDYGVSASVPGYEVDLFGRVRNLSDSALSTYFASRENRRSAQVLLVADVVTAWLTLAADQQRLTLSLQTYDSQRSTLDLTQKIRDLGGSTGLVVAQVRSTVEAARVQIAAYRTQIDLDRNALELLLGSPLADIDDPNATIPVDAGVLLDVPSALPSSVLVRRPDVQSSERRLQATYADIGAARAAYFPRITLTTSVGTASSALNGLFRSGNGSWSFGPSITLPIFDAGVNAANLANAVADRDIAVATYEKTLQSAFREVADVLAARRTLGERTAGQLAYVDALATSLTLSDAVFRQGSSNYLTVLTAQQTLYGAQQGLISLRLEEQTSRVALYKAFGGGWKDREESK